MVLLKELEEIEQWMYHCSGFLGAIEKKRTLGHWGLIFSLYFLLPSYMYFHVNSLTKVQFEVGVFKMGIIANFGLILVKGVYFYWRREGLRASITHLTSYETTRAWKGAAGRRLKGSSRVVALALTCFATAVTANALVWEWLPTAAAVTGGGRLPNSFPEITKPDRLTSFVIYVYESLAGIAASYLFLAVDLLVIALTLSVRTQYEVLNLHLKRTINKEYTPCMKRKVDVEQMRDNDLKMFIRDHQKLVRVCRNLREYLSPIMAFQLLTSVITIGFVTYGFRCHPPPLTGSMLDYIIHFLQNLVYFIVSFLELILFCGLSQTIIQVNDDLYKTILFSQWIFRKKDFKKKLLIILIRCKVKPTFTALNMIEIELKIFSQLLRLSYSYYSVLKQIED